MTLRYFCLTNTNTIFHELAYLPYLPTYLTYLPYLPIKLYLMSLLAPIACPREGNSYASIEAIPLRL
jgi:hypothetical protein